MNLTEKTSEESDGLNEKKGAFLKRILTDLKNSFYFIWDIGKTLIFVIAIAFLIRFYLVQPFYVEGQSMEPGFNNGEYLLIDELTYHFRSPERGEVIVFRPPISTYQNYIKRIIALPGEEIDFQNNSNGDFIIKNQKHITGETLEEPYLNPNTPTRSEKDVKLEDQNYFVMGDNRTQSSDSRIFGPVFKKNITGRVWFYIKMEPWKSIHLGGLKLTIPKIKSMGRIAKPQYKIDNLSFSIPQDDTDRHA
ncbi:MAG: signal peptidase I [Patescibacteria group bacterium]|nr:signal peptidase I [Patescibacteria group bacterium]